MEEDRDAPTFRPQILILGMITMAIAPLAWDFYRPAYGVCCLIVAALVISRVQWR